MSKDEALAHIEEIEMKKASEMAEIVMAAQMGHFPKERIPEAAEITKIKILDELYKDKGVDNDDILIACHKHQIQHSEELAVILQKAQQHVG